MQDKKSPIVTRRTFVGGAAALGGIALLPAAARPAFASTPTPAPTTLPDTIAALREWMPAHESYTFGPGSQIVLAGRNERTLSETARLLAQDLHSFGIAARNVVVSSRRARPGDIVLQLGSPDDALGAEGYALNIGAAAVIDARTELGVFNGTQTLLQLLHQSARLPGGTARDWPIYPQRGFMVDLGRMYLSLDWLKARVRDMAYLKMNTLHLHLTDDQGWRIESSLGLQSAQYLTKNEIRELVAYAAEYHVTVVPEIDMPAHLGALLEKYPQYQLADASGTLSPTLIDFTIPGVIDLLKSIIAEYLPLFPGCYWHLGQDEYLANSQFANYPQLLTWAQAQVGPNAVAKDAVIQFANEMNAFVRSRAKIGRMWNDNVGPGTTIHPDTNIVVEWWTDADSDDYFGPNGPYTPQTLLDMGYQIFNCSDLPTYAYPPGGQTPQLNPAYMYDSWSVEEFYGYLYQPDGNGGYTKYLPTKTVAVGAPGFLGSSLNDWNSGGTWTPDEAAADISPRLRIIAQKTWESPQTAADYTAFQTVIAAVGSPVS